MHLPVLFQPSDLLSKLSDSPKVAKVVGSAISRFSTDSTIPHVKKSDHPLLFLLGHGDGDFLERWKKRLEWALTKGWKSHELLDAPNFHSTLGEIYSAALLESSDRQITRASHGDFSISYNSSITSLEVYSPSQLLALKSFYEWLKNAVEQLDTPYDYSFTLSYETIETWDEQEEAFFRLSEEAQCEQLEVGNTAQAIVSHVCESITMALLSECDTSFCTEHQNVGLRIEINLNDIRNIQSGLPRRGGSIFSHSSNILSHLFERIEKLIQTNIRNKLAQKQSSTGVIVYIGEMIDRHLFVRDFGADQVARILEREYRTHNLPCGFVAFMLPAPGTEANFEFTHVVYKQNREDFDLTWFGDAIRIPTT